MSHIAGKATSHSTGSYTDHRCQYEKSERSGRTEDQCQTLENGAVNSAPWHSFPAPLPKKHASVQECSRLAVERWQQAPEPHGGALEGGSAGSARIKKRLTEEGRC